MSDLRQWIEIGILLDHRAKVYSRSENNEGGGRRSSEYEDEGFLVIRQIQKLKDGPKPAPGQFEWIFAPLLDRLLSSLCDWVCLGHFVGDASNPDRRWLYALSDRLSPNHMPSESSETQIKRDKPFTRALRFLSFNASFPELSLDVMDRTSQLIERCLLLEQPDVKAPAGAFLLVTMQSDSDGSPFNWEISKRGESDRYFHLDLRDEVQKSADAKSASEDPLLSVPIPDAHDDGRLELPIGFLWKEKSQKHAAEEAARSYVSNLKELFPDNHKLAEIDVGGAYSSSIRAVLDEGDTQAKMARYAAWIRDVSPTTSAILTIPAWLPGRGALGRSGALIASFKKGVKLDLETIYAIASAFRLGCANIVADDAKQSGALRQSHLVSHTAIGLVEEVRRQVRQNAPINVMSEACLWHLSNLMAVWSTRGIDAEAKASEIAGAWQNHNARELLDSMVCCALTQSVWRASARNSDDADEAGRNVRAAALVLRNESEPGEALFRALNAKIELPGSEDSSKEVPEWVDTQGFAVCFEHSLWQAGHHALRAKYAGATEKEVLLQIKVSPDRVEIRNRVVPSTTDQKTVAFARRDIEFLELLNERVNGHFSIKGPEKEGQWCVVTIKRDSL